MARWLLIALVMLTASVMVGCRDGISTEDAVQSQREIDERKDPDWQD